MKTTTREIGQALKIVEKKYEGGELGMCSWLKEILERSVTDLGMELEDIVDSQKEQTALLLQRIVDDMDRLELEDNLAR